MWKSITSILLLLVPLKAFADSADIFWGTYQGFSRGCQNSFIVLDKDKVSIDECKELSYTRIESDSEHVLIELSPTIGCGSPFIRIEREKRLKFGGFVIKTYASREQALADKYYSYCSYGQVDPSLAKDQTKRFLDGTTDDERRDALLKINQQGHLERDKYNELGLSDKSPRVRGIAATFLRGNPDRFVPMLIDLIVGDPDARVRANAARSLSHFYTDNGSEGDLYIAPLESNLDKILLGLWNAETMRSLVEILGSRYTADSVAPCYMSVRSREEALNALKSLPDRVHQLAAEARSRDAKAPWDRQYNDIGSEIERAVKNIKECHLTKP